MNAKSFIKSAHPIKEIVKKNVNKIYQKMKAINVFIKKGNVKRQIKNAQMGKIVIHVKK